MSPVVIVLALAFLPVQAEPRARGPSQASEGREALLRAIAFFGGESAILAHETQITTSDVVLANAAKGRRVSWVKCVERAREELSIGGQHLVVATDGKRTWRGSQHGAIPTRSAQLTASLRIACLGHMLLEAERGDIRVELVEGPKDVQRLRLGNPRGEEFLIDVALDDGRIRRFEMPPRNDKDGADPRVIVELDRWAPEGGYPIARFSRWHVTGAQTEERSIVSVGRNARLVDDIFAPQPLGLSPHTEPGAIDL